MKLTDEQLSRVMTAHAAGELKRGGYNYGDETDAPCLFQAAIDYTSAEERRFDDNVMWFDDNYQRDWSVEMFLTQLEIRGLA